MNILKYDTIKSLYNKHIKLHFVDDNIFASIKAKEETHYYSTPLFPGDDRDLITEMQTKEMWWKQDNKDLVDKIKEINTYRCINVLFYYEGEGNNMILKDVKPFSNDIKPTNKEVIKIFPHNPERDRISKSFEEELEEMDSLARVIDGDPV
jgi:hypothetical protein